MALKIIISFWCALIVGEFIFGVALYIWYRKETKKFLGGKKGKTVTGRTFEHRFGEEVKSEEMAERESEARHIIRGDKLQIMALEEALNSKERQVEIQTNELDARTREINELRNGRS